LQASVSARTFFFARNSRAIQEKSEKSEKSQEKFALADSAGCARRTCLVSYRKIRPCVFPHILQGSVCRALKIKLSNKNNCLIYFFKGGTAVATGSLHRRCFAERVTTNEDLKGYVERRSWMHFRAQMELHGNLI
jgi:hypothetical protein